MTLGILFHECLKSLIHTRQPRVIDGRMPSAFSAVDVRSWGFLCLVLHVEGQPFDGFADKVA